MTEKSMPVEVWAINCPCRDCDSLLGLTIEKQGEVLHAAPVFLSRYDAERWFIDWARTKISRRAARGLAAKLIRKVDPKSMEPDTDIYCPEGHIHRWDEWYLAAVSEMN